MSVPKSEVGYTSATTGRGDHEVHKEHVVALAPKKLLTYVELLAQCPHSTDPHYTIDTQTYEGLYS
jgi:hypothetical protein